MKTTAKSKEGVLKFGDFVAGAYRAWGKRRAKGLVRLAINAQAWSSFEGGSAS